MNPQQYVSFLLQRLTTPADALALWPFLQKVYPGCSLMLACDEGGPIDIPADRNFGRAHLLSGLSAERLLFLNERTVRELSSGGLPQVAVAYWIAIDTSAASVLRSLFGGGGHSGEAEFLDLLTACQGDWPNWNIDPYLHENGEGMNNPQHEQEIFETALATAHLNEMDRDYFRATKQFRFRVPDAAMARGARRYLDEFVWLWKAGWRQEVRVRWLLLHASVLKLALLEAEEPDAGAGLEKMKALLRFMDEDIACMMGQAIALAAERFSRGPRAAVLDRLQPGAEDLVRSARAVSWTLFHHHYLYRQANTPRNPAEFFVPCFLTLDPGLVDLFQIYSIKACLVDPRNPFPQVFPKVPLENVLEPLTTDPEFLSRYHTTEAITRRAQRSEIRALPNVERLVSRLEGELAKFQSTL